METIFIGIDPGLTGAVAVVHPERTPVFFDTPVLKVGDKHEYNVAEMTALLRQVAPVVDGVHVAIEKVHAMPVRHSVNRCPLCGRGDSMGSVSAFRMGFGLALWIGIVVALRLPYTLVSPQRWKGALMDGQPKDKDASRQVAMRLFPSAVPQLWRKKDHGRADALLIAEWASRNMGF